MSSMDQRVSIAFCDAYTFLYRCTPLPVFQIIIKIGSFVFGELLTPLYKWIKDSMRIIYYYLRPLVPHVSTCVVRTIGSFCDACIFFYGYTLLSFSRAILTVSPYIYREVLKPVSKLALYIARMFCDTLYRFVYCDLGWALYSLGQFFYIYLLQPSSSVVSTVLPVIVKISSEIFNVLHSGLNATALAVATSGRAIASIFRVDTYT
jgi:hypothetical protein